MISTFVFCCSPFSFASGVPKKQRTKFVFSIFEIIMLADTGFKKMFKKLTVIHNYYKKTELEFQEFH